MKSGILPWFLIAAVVSIGAVASLVSSDTPEEVTPRQISYFRIATASPSGTYYPVGQLLASLISGPAESYCGEGGPCGVPGVIGLAEVSEGSVANLRAVNAGLIESGLAQGDLVDSAVRGVGRFANEQRMRGVRAVANLYFERFHLVVAPDSGIGQVSDLAGKRLSIDRKGSGSFVEGMALLKAFDLTDRGVELFYEPPGKAAELLAAGRLDAIFFVGGYPAVSIAELAREHPVRLVPLAGPQIDQMMRDNPSLIADVIPAGSYVSEDNAVPTLSVGAQWIVNAGLDEERVYQVTRALWDERNRPAWQGAHERATEITSRSALTGITIPLHAGALRYYREVGLLPVVETPNPDVAD